MFKLNLAIPTICVLFLPHFLSLPHLYYPSKMIEIKGRAVVYSIQGCPYCKTNILSMPACTETNSPMQELTKVQFNSGE